jgi:hypothetical protein
MNAVPAHERWAAAAAPGVRPPVVTLTDALVESLARSVPQPRPRARRVTLVAPSMPSEPVCPGERLLTFTDKEFARRLALEAMAVRIERLRAELSETRSARTRFRRDRSHACCPMCDRSLDRRSLKALLAAIEADVVARSVDIQYFEQRVRQLRSVS